ncbi:hypothetical protein CEXT_535261 [Caerostris extrusa]|uniref:Uncharacterized protein n=1 Tax=Caerostris extrusa TaxID=172846 RepID=A0AAV4WUR9_CAEEX|nr:hypothetical protein CEXT_535261 [Caerostris extrusa]
MSDDPRNCSPPGTSHSSCRLTLAHFFSSSPLPPHDDLAEALPGDDEAVGAKCLLIPNKWTRFAGEKSLTMDMKHFSCSGEVAALASLPLYGE